LANIKSQIKRNRQNEKRRLRNRFYRGGARTAVSNARVAFATDAPDTKEAVLRAISTLDKAAEKGVLHPNNAARRKSRLMSRLAALGGTPSALKVDEPKKVGTQVMEEAAEGRKKAPAKKAAATDKKAAKKSVEKKPAVKTTKKAAKK
jgi:small subunit ribosomal protein S20